MLPRLPTSSLPRLPTFPLPLFTTSSLPHFLTSLLLRRDRIESQDRRVVPLAACEHDGVSRVVDKAIWGAAAAVGRVLQVAISVCSEALQTGLERICLVVGLVFCL
jgi:hypothetical protein